MNRHRLLKEDPHRSFPPNEVPTHSRWVKGKCILRRFIDGLMALTLLSVISAGTVSALALSSNRSDPPSQTGAGAPAGNDSAHPAEDTAPAAPTGTEEIKAEIKKAMDDQRKEFLDLLGGPNKAASPIVTCTWSQAGPSSGTDSKHPGLDCTPALLVSGSVISTVRVAGLPNAGRVTVTVTAADYWYPLRPVLESPPFNDLTFDSLTFDDHPESVLIQVHKDRYVRPSYGGTFSSKANAKASLRETRSEGPSLKRANNTLGIVLSSSPLLLQVQVSVQEKGKADLTVHSAPVYIVYQRWAMETGGFLALTNIGDQTLITSTREDGMVHVDGIERSHGLTQETGIFLNIIPRNYEFFGIGFGLATPSDRAQSIYLGISLRARTFGGSGLASLFLGAVDRQVRVFRGVVGQDFAADSTKLKGSLESKVSYAFGFNLGFKFGSIGGGDSAAPQAAATGGSQ